MRSLIPHASASLWRSSVAKLRITYTKSAIGYAQDQKHTIRNLGLRRMGQSVVHEDNRSIRGMVHKVRHLVTVEEVEEQGNGLADR